MSSTPPPSKVRPASDATIARAVERWFLSNERDLPWRRKRSGYTALVSEAMLQQTQVSRVIEKYQAFMRQFPTIASLASAEEQAVLAAWQGLGYYGRAKRLHAAAKAVMERFGGRVPTTVAELRTLPGIGPYTAGAIASIAFGEREPIVDTNVARVLMRLVARPGSAQHAENVRFSWERATALVQAADDPARFNEGLMELGATVCPAGEPACERCPLRRFCHAHASGLASAIPEPTEMATRRRVYHHAVVVVRHGSVLLEQRPSRGLWASMWQVPTIESDEALGVGEVAKRLTHRVDQLIRERELVHQTSHREVVFVIHRGRSRTRASASTGTWVTSDTLGTYALSNPMRAIVREALAL